MHADQNSETGIVNLEVQNTNKPNADSLAEPSQTQDDGSVQHASVVNQSFEGNISEQR